MARLQTSFPARVNLLCSGGGGGGGRSNCHCLQGRHEYMLTDRDWSQSDLREVLGLTSRSVYVCVCVCVVVCVCVWLCVCVCVFKLLHIGG